MLVIVNFSWTLKRILLEMGYSTVSHLQDPKSWCWNCCISQSHLMELQHKTLREGSGWMGGGGGHPFAQLWNKHLVTLCQGRVRFKTILWMSVSAFVCMESFLFSCAFWVSYVFGCVCLCEAIFQSYLSEELCSEYVSHTHFLQLSLHLRNSKKNLNQILLDCQ